MLASDPSYLGGSWDAKTSEKAERFVKMADQFRLPIVHLVDNPGFMIGGEAERTGTIRYGVQAMNAIYRATVPLRVGGGTARVRDRGQRDVERRALPVSLRLAVGRLGQPADRGRGRGRVQERAGRAAEDPAAHLEAIRGRLNRVRSPFRTAEKFGVEDIIDPRDTRPLLCEFADLAWRVLNSPSVEKARHRET